MRRARRIPDAGVSELRRRRRRLRSQRPHGRRPTGHGRRRVLVLERADRIGGGTRTAALPSAAPSTTSARPRIRSAIASPAFAALGLEDLRPRLAASADRDRPPVRRRHGGRPPPRRRHGGRAGPRRCRYRSLVAPLLHRWDEVSESLLAPLVPLPHHPSTMARFGLVGLPSASLLARRFREPGPGPLRRPGRPLVPPLSTR